MDYEVILTYPTKAQLDHAVDYILCEFESEQAALSVMEDAEETRLRLSRVTGSLKLCDDPKLRALGYRTIHFNRHKYFMLYRIESNQIPRCKQRGINLAALQSSGVFDPRGIRQMLVQARHLAHCSRE